MSALVDIRPAERRPALAAFLGLLGITAGHTLLETARDALFLAKLPAARLPWMYMAIAAVGLLLARLRRSPKGKAGGAADGRNAVVRSLLLSAVVDVGFWVASSWKGTWFLYALYVWTGIFASWVIVEFWLLLSSSFTVGQAKRVFGFIGAGSVLGAVGGAAAARALAGFLPAQHLLLGAAVTLVATAVGPVLLLRADPVGETTSGGSAGRASLRTDLTIVSRDPYIKRILALTLLATVALTTVDFLFKYAVAARKQPSELAAYFANVSIVLNSAALVVQVGLVGWALRTLGLHRALWIMPALLVGGAGGVLAGGGLTAALLLKGADGALRHSLHKTGTELLYVPLPDATRGRVKPFIDLVGQRGGQAVASLGILGLMALGVGEKGLAVAVALLAAAWIAVANGLRSHYLEVFRATLRDGKMDFQGDLPALDLGALEALFGALNSSKDSEVLGALDLLAAQRRQRLIPALILYHPSKAVVLRALEIFTREGRADFLPIVDRLLSHADPELRAAALRARVAAAPDETFLRARRADECLEVRATAVVGSMARGWLVGAEAEAALEKLSADASPAVRIALAQAIGAVAAQAAAAEDEAPLPPEVALTLGRTLLAMAEAADGPGAPAVTAEVAAAMGRLKSDRFLPVLTRWIVLREPGPAAREALAAMGASALRHLSAAMEDPGVPEDVRIAIPRAVALFEPARAAEVLLPQLERSEGMLRFRILRALSALRADDPDLELDPAILGRVAEATVRATLRLLDWRCSLAAGAAADASRATPAHELLMTMLRDKEAHALGRLFRLLGLLHPHENFERIHRGLLKQSAKTRASSRELVENLVAPPLRAVILALIDELPDDERVARAAPWYQAEKPTYDDVMRRLLARGDEAASVAAYHAAEIGLGVTAPPSAGAAPAAPSALVAGLAEQARTRGRVAHAP